MRHPMGVTTEADSGARASRGTCDGQKGWRLAACRGWYTGSRHGDLRRSCSLFALTSSLAACHVVATDWVCLLANNRAAAWMSNRPKVSGPRHHSEASAYAGMYGRLMREETGNRLGWTEINLSLKCMQVSFLPSIPYKRAGAPRILLLNARIQGKSEDNGKEITSVDSLTLNWLGGISCKRSTNLACRFHTQQQRDATQPSRRCRPGGEATHLRPSTWKLE